MSDKRILALPPEVIGQIAAGEVVERPAAAVKELVENALDAGATAVTVDIREGGVSLLRVTDNGSGIDQRDVRMAFERHATSKLRTAQELSGVATLGFRGEALASIAAVSHVRLTTRTGDAEAGLAVQNDGGQITDIREAACPRGTSVTVKDLFYNAPVRKKFLKKASFETAAVTELMTRFILSRPDIAFRYQADGRNIFQSPGDGREESAVLAVFGLDVLRLMTRVKGTMNGVAVSGYVGVGDLSRSNRSQEYFFLNNRVMKSALLDNAVETACHQRVMIGRFPMCVLHLTMPFENADVNVHPNKWEVRFQNEFAVRDAVETLVRDALEQTQKKDLLTPRMYDDERLAQRRQPEARVEARPTAVSSAPSPMPAAAPAASAVPGPVSKAPAVSPAVPEQKPSASPVWQPAPARPAAFHAPRPVWQTEEEKPAASPIPAQGADAAPPPQGTPGSQPVQEEIPHALEKRKVRVIGVAFKTYILMECGEELILCDQHAAHERLLYERLLRETKQGPASQTLMIPRAVRVSHTQMAAYEDNRELLEKIGFDLSPFGDDTLQLRGVPVVLGAPEAEGCLTDTLDELYQYGRLDSYDKTLRIASAACRHAVKGGEDVPPEELSWLVEQILNGDMPPTCPHGRPLMVTLSHTELDKRFRRIQQAK